MYHLSHLVHDRQAPKSSRTSEIRLNCPKTRSDRQASTKTKEESSNNPYVPYMVGFKTVMGNTIVTSGTSTGSHIHQKKLAHTVRAFSVMQGEQVQHFSAIIKV